MLKKRFLALMLSVAMITPNLSGFTIAKAEEMQTETQTETTVIEEPEEYKNLIWTDETSDEIIYMVENGLDLSHFFVGELVKDITVEDLKEWLKEGYDIEDIVDMRANLWSASLAEENIDNTIKGFAPVRAKTSKYYLTKVIRKTSGAINLNTKYLTTQISNYLKNPITALGVTSTSIWYVELGSVPAVCMSIGQGANDDRTYDYVRTTIANTDYKSYIDDEKTEKALQGVVTYYQERVDAGITADGPLYTALQIAVWEIVAGTFSYQYYEAGRPTSDSLLAQYNASVQVDSNVIEYIATQLGYSSANISNTVAHFDKMKEYANLNITQNKYDETNIYIWEPSTATGRNAWQTFITWDTPAPTEEYDVKVNKKSRQAEVNVSNATYTIYKTRNGNTLTNAVKTVKTDENGEFIVKLDKGTYYLQETAAPGGYVLDTTIYTLTVNDDLTETKVDDDSYEATVTMKKRDRITEEPLAGAEFTIYENIGTSSDPNWKKVGVMNDAGNGNYNLSGKSMQYHKANGTNAETETGKLVYTDVNNGHFKIAETKAPAGYKLNTSERRFRIDKDGDENQTFAYNFTSETLKAYNEDGIQGTVKVRKSSKSTGQKLSGAEFTIYEWNRNTSAYKEVGKLRENGSHIYVTDGATFKMQKDNATGNFESETSTDKLTWTSTNQGKFKVVETKAPTGFKIDGFSKTFTISTDGQEVGYTADAGTDAKNTPYKAKITLNKYDNVTQTLLKGAIFTVYEWNISKNTWLEIGTMKDNGNGIYTTVAQSYFMYNTDGTAAYSDKTSGEYSLWYSPQNQGKFRVKETVSPAGYVLSGQTIDIQIDTSGAETQAFSYDTYTKGIKENPEYMYLDIDKISETHGDRVYNATFKVQEWSVANNNYVDILKTDGKVLTLTESTTTKGRHSLGTASFYQYEYSVSGVKNTTPETMQGKLRYTTNNLGCFRLVETKNADGHKLGNSSGITYKNFSFADATATATAGLYYANLTGTKGFPDIPYSASVLIKKVDAETGSIIRNNATFKLYEYNSETQNYTENTQGITITKNTSGYYVSTGGKKGNGCAYWTNANQGKFYIEETSSPNNYQSDSVFGTSTTLNKYYFVVESTGYASNYDSDGVYHVGDGQTYEPYRNSDKGNGYDDGEFTNDHVTGVITVAKKDKETNDFMPQANATLEGAEFALIPKTDIVHPDGYTGVIYPALSETVLNEKLAELKKYESIINDTTNTFTEEEVIEAVNKSEEVRAYLRSVSAAYGTVAYNGGTEQIEVRFTDLYLGQYNIVEITPSEGYLLNTQYVSKTLSYSGPYMHVVYNDATINEQVVKQAFKFTKLRESAANKDELIPLEGAEFKVYLVSELSKLADNDLTDISDDDLEELIATLYATGITMSTDASYDFSGEQVATVYNEDDENGLLTKDGVTSGNVNEYRVATLTSNEDGYVQSPELPYGKYVVVETKNPTTTLLDIKPFIVNVTKDGVSFTNKEVDLTKRAIQSMRYMVDRTLKLRLKIVKKDSVTGESVLNNKATYRIYSYDEDRYVTQSVLYPEVVTYSEFTTTNDGYLILPDKLTAGSYRLEEVVAPNGYVKVGFEAYYDLETNSIIQAPLSQVDFVIDKNSEFSTEPITGDILITVEQMNAEQVGVLRIYKEGEMLTGIEELIYEKSAKENEGLAYDIKTTNRKFVYTKKKLENVKFSIEVAEDIYTLDGQGNIAYYTDIEGNTYKLNKGTVIGNVITNAEGFAVLPNLPIGKYYVKEVSTIDGFVLDNTVYEVDIKPANDETAVILFDLKLENERQKINFDVAKTSATTGTGVKGAVYALYTTKDIYDCENNLLLEAGEIIETRISGEEGKLNFEADVPFGLYKIVEIQAPLGYEINSTPRYYDCNYKGQYVESIYFDEPFANETVKAMVSVDKLDAHTKECLEGVKFELQDKDGNVIDNFVTNHEGKASSKMIEVYEYENGNIKGYKEYFLVETETLPGYSLADPVKFTFENVELDGDENIIIKYVEIENDYTKVQINKQDLTNGGKNIPGAVLAIYDSEGKLYDKFVTTEEGVMIEKMPAGKYTLEEKRCPYGYIFAETIEFEVLPSGEIQTVTMYDEEAQGSLTIIKVDKATQELIEGAKFELRNSKGKVLQTVTTNENGEAEFKPVPVCAKGEDAYSGLAVYTLAETVAAPGYLIGEDDKEISIKFEYNAKCHSEKILKVDNERSIGIPDTGDNNYYMYVIIVGALAVVVFVAMSIVKRKNKNE